MYINTRPSENLALLATVDAASQAVGTVASNWVNAGQDLHVLGLIKTGVLGVSATVDAKLQQATDASGTGVKDVLGKAITQVIAATGNNKQVYINLKGQELDVTNGFSFVRLSITVGGSASIVDGTVFGMFPRFGSAEALNQAAVAQIVA